MDSNIIINGFDVYPPDRFPSYWIFLNGLVEQGELLFHTEVCDELLKREDEKSEWLREKVPPARRIRVEQPDIDSMRRVTEWAVKKRQPRYEERAAREFLEVADSWLVATAYSRGLALISNETSSPRKVNRVKLPDAASAFGLKYYTGLDFLRAKGIAF